jgi:hypothetical protein
MKKTIPSGPPSSSSLKSPNIVTAKSTANTAADQPSQAGKLRVGIADSAMPAYSATSAKPAGMKNSSQNLPSTGWSRARRGRRAAEESAPARRRT